MASKTASTMSVTGMGKLLGLKKTDSYYLLHKNCFETIMINGKIRIVTESFEQWYEHQDRYQKVNGAKPGCALREQSLSIADIADMLAISKDTAAELVKNAGFTTIWQDYKFRVPRNEFDLWYASQIRYRNAEDREKDREAKDASMTVPEMGRLLGIDRREAWKLYTRAKNVLELIRVAGRPRITRASFETWYGSQSQYQIVKASTPEPTCTETEMPVDLSKEYYSIEEASVILKINVKNLRRMIVSKDIHGRKIGRQWYIPNEEILDLLGERNA